MNTVKEMKRETLILDGREVAVAKEESLLELARREGIDIPTFCYHSHLSVYGACRLCLVEIEGQGIVASCSAQPRAGMVVRTNTPAVRRVRKVAVELLLANHDRDCPTCPSSATCKLQNLARRLGVDEVRLPSVLERRPVDRSTSAIVRDPNRCVLCGDCVRMCEEVQGIGAIDFANRGHDVTVQPAFGKKLSDVDCVLCGGCVSVCPTGALAPRSEVEAVWADLGDEKKTVVVQVAPAVRVGLGEHFGLAPGASVLGQLTTALRHMGFDAVYDTSFAADLTVLEEGSELLKRIEEGQAGPQLSSCCPAWVRFVEQSFPDMLGNLSTCRSPQQMFGAVAREALPQRLGVRPEDLVVVSIMPCTAKKAEARREEFTVNGRRDVDHVLTTTEVARMIEEAGLRFGSLTPSSLDLPFGFKTGAGVIFGVSGGVTEATIRFIAEARGGEPLEAVDFHCVRGDPKNGTLRTAKIEAGGRELSVAVVSGLGEARALMERIRKGEEAVDFVEVMACPGGCVAGAGQPCCDDETLAERSRGLYDADTELQLHKAQDNPAVRGLYDDVIGEIGGPRAHELLHTRYRNRRRITEQALRLVGGADGDSLEVKVCVGTNCHLRGARELLHGVLRTVEERGLDVLVTPSATFCFERCSEGPNVAVGERLLTHCTLDKVMSAVDEELARRQAVKSA